MSDVFHSYVIQQCRGTGKFVGHTHITFLENGLPDKTLFTDLALETSGRH